MDIEKLIEAVKLCGSTPKVDQCKRCAYWAGGDMSKCIPRMTTAAATALSTLQAENEKLRSDLRRLQTERDTLWAANQHLLAERDADREGWCVVLPCEVGSTVYMPFCDKVVEMRIGQFHVNGYTMPRIWADIDCDWATTQRVRWDLAFGKTVFLTRAEAEAALRREQE